MFILKEEISSVVSGIKSLGRLMTILLRRDFNFSRKAEEDKEVLVDSSRKYIIKGLTGYPIKVYPSPLEHKDLYSN